MYSATVQIILTKHVTDEMHQTLTKVAAKLKENCTLRHNEETVVLTVEGEKTATDFLVQFEKQVRIELGKKFKTGIKEMILTKYLITEELEEMPEKEITIPFATLIFKH